MALAAPDLRDAGRDVPKACGDGASPGVHRVYGDSGGFQEGLDLRLQVWEVERLEQKLGESHQRRHGQEDSLATLVSALVRWPRTTT